MSNPNQNYNPAAQPAPPNFQSVEDQYRQSVETSSTTSRAITEAESLARSIKDGALSGYVGNGTTLTGETDFKSMLRVDGQLTGKITSEAGTLIVGNQGRLDANVEVAVATIHGTVNGDITASQRLELGRTAKVMGNVTTPSLMIEQGAVFEGSCQMIKAREDSETRERQAMMPKNEPATTGSMAAKPAVEPPAMKKPETTPAPTAADGNKAATA